MNNHIITNKKKVSYQRIVLYWLIILLIAVFSIGLLIIVNKKLEFFIIAMIFLGISIYSQCIAIKKNHKIITFLSMEFLLISTLSLLQVIFQHLNFKMIIECIFLFIIMCIIINFYTSYIMKKIINTNLNNIKSYIKYHINSFLIDLCFYFLLFVLFIFPLLLIIFNNRQIDWASYYSTIFGSLIAFGGATFVLYTYFFDIHRNNIQIFIKVVRELKHINRLLNDLSSVIEHFYISFNSYKSRKGINILCKRVHNILMFYKSKQIIKKLDNFLSKYWSLMSLSKSSSYRKSLTRIFNKLNNDSSSLSSYFDNLQVSYEDCCERKDNNSAKDVMAKLHDLYEFDISGDLISLEAFFIFHMNY